MKCAKFAKFGQVAARTAKPLKPSMSARYGSTFLRDIKIY